MFLEKIRRHLYKVLFLLSGIFLVMISVVINKQEGVEHEKENSALSGDNSANTEIAEVSALDEVVTDEAQVSQDAIAADRQQKLDSVANNPAVVVKQETVPVTTVVQGATRKVTVPSDSSSSKSSSAKSSTTSSASTKTS